MPLFAIAANATTFAPLFSTSLAASKADPPVVIISSQINIFSFSFTSNPLLKVISPFTLSVKINLTPSALASSYPANNPPIAGEHTLSTSIPASFICFANSFASFSAISGRSKTLALWR